MTPFARLLQHRRDSARVSRSRQAPGYLTRTGKGLDYVKRIRNRLALGTASFPIPDRGDGRSDLDFAIIQQCTRVVLFAIHEPLVLSRSARVRMAG